MPGIPHRPLADGDVYQPLHGVARADLAWEWLRRDPDYRRLVPGLVQETPDGRVIARAPDWCVARWGCLCISDPERLAMPPMLWSIDVQPSVLCVEARHREQDDLSAFDLRRWRQHSTLVVGPAEREHLLLSGYGQRLRLDVVAGTVREGAVDLRYLFTPDSDTEPAITTLRRFLCMLRTGNVPALPTDRGLATRRSIDAVRVHDALATGASIRDIAILLFGADRVRSEWHAPGEALKSQCRRLIAHARHMADGGYKALLR